MCCIDIDTNVYFYIHTMIYMFIYACIYYLCMHICIGIHKCITLISSNHYFDEYSFEDLLISRNWTIYFV